MGWVNKFIEKHPLWFLTLLLVILFIFSFWFTYVFVFSQSPMGVISEETSSGWLQWTGSFIGGSLGGIFAFVGIRITLENQRKEVRYENKRKALPFIDINDSEYDYKNKYIQFDFHLTEDSKQGESKDISDTAKITISIENVGMREMYNLYLGDFESEFFFARGEYFSVIPIVYKNKSLDLTLSFYEKLKYDNVDSSKLDNLLISPLRLSCYFRDCYDNWYYQQFSVNLFHKFTSNCPENTKALDVGFSGSDVLSQPLEIPFEDLPWEQGKQVTSL